jgi:hypothetical protein
LTSAWESLRFNPSGICSKTVGRDAKLGVDITAPFVVWDAEHVDVTANEALAAASGMVAGAAKQEACEFLLDRLAAGPVKVDDLTEEAKHNGIAIKTLRRAKKELDIKSRKESGQLGGEWMWELPPIVNRRKVASVREMAIFERAP